MTVNKQSVYLQIADDFKRRIDLGLLREGERLASCRELALKLGINPNTVQRAYSALEEQGYIYTIPKKGIYVSQRNGIKPVEKTAKEKIAELYQAGLPRETLLTIINEIYGEKYD